MLFGLVVFWQMRVYYIDVKMTCLSERSLPSSPPRTVRRSPLCICWNRFGSTCFAYLGRHLAAIENKQTNTPQSYISCNCLRDTKQNLADKRRCERTFKNECLFWCKAKPRKSLCTTRTSVMRSFVFSMRCDVWSVSSFQSTVLTAEEASVYHCSRQNCGAKDEEGIRLRLCLIKNATFVSQHE